MRLFSPNLDKAALVHYRVQGYDLRGLKRLCYKGLQSEPFQMVQVLRLFFLNFRDTSQVLSNVVLFLLKVGDQFLRYTSNSREIGGSLTESFETSSVDHLNSTSQRLSMISQYDRTEGERADKMM